MFFCCEWLLVQVQSVDRNMAGCWGENAVEVIDAVRHRLEELSAGLPDGVELVVVYDRSDLIVRAQSSLRGKLTEELLLVSLVCALFLMTIRSALVACGSMAYSEPSGATT